MARAPGPGPLAAVGGLRGGEAEDRSGRERQDLADAREKEGGAPPLFPAHPRRTHRVTRYADDAGVLAEEIERLHGLFGQANDALGRKHAGIITRNGS